MKQAALTLLLSVALPAAALAQDGAGVPVPANQAAGFDRIREGDLRADLGLVASDALQGRMSLQPGDDATVQWVAAEFAKAGLEPAAQDAAGAPSFLQSVPLVEYRPNAAANFVALRSGNATRRWQAPHLVGGYRDDVDITAPLVFAGYGITAPGVSYDDYRGIDAKGRIVVVFEHEPQENDPASRFGGTGNTRYATNRVKALNAQAHGALALVVMAEPNRKHPSNFDRMMRIGGSAKRTPPIPAQALVDDALHIPVITVDDEAGAALLAGTGQSASALQAAIDRALVPQSRAVPGAEVTLHLENTVRSRGTTWNVAGLLKGSDPTLAPETVIISAHHDHDGSSGPEIWHGADDNGSGTVGVVELARAFMANGARPRRSILFTVFAAEERGLLGAYYMAAHPLRPLATTRAMINFDMIGRNEAPSDQTTGLIDIPADTTNRLNLIGAAYSPDYARTVAEANRSVGLVLDDRFDHENALNVFFRSDQFPFVLNNIPAFWFFTGFHPDYHHTTDTADKINYGKMTRILKLTYLSAWRFADEATPPAFVADPPGKR
ncbi:MULTISPECIES: M20/M25/M40 family metallo-hydrolase [unclassified Novosphingobium]|uniref:M20/M25/M40 family metallo-hydrolase n=1 Tax=unclassified Novosphingobium TaxID=2644732 RepID=UPI000D3163C5|nr:MULTISPECIES: M20/M25/M40 family metallo-hydrolase [unclassified Novosphingobium]PTR13293.1 Zn-dependent M28 family amino/carboxypeptidase [Novosphingobium sp. GV055]PUB07512.1 Zn-dependent M28 family amino/carboxypeptidase [Novosphingobium sp. GV061]PUB23325.1 Zn-dependent M28 family amino/carboxypeptidase [Novosphingobium sp. GV079]PUB45089.1 Zn-dependent M28 family amino/carboxypeptidase [Novosphingobium sp. GV027]